MKRMILKMMLAFVCLFGVGQPGYGQMEDPIHWTFAAKKLDASTYEVSLTATLEAGWHIYSQTTPEGGPVATTITFARNPLLTLEGSPKEIGKLEQKHEPLFGVDVRQYSNKVVFVQRIQVKGKAKTVVTGSVEYMSCDDEMCLPPAVKKFSIPLN